MDSTGGPAPDRTPDSVPSSSVSLACTTPARSQVRAPLRGGGTAGRAGGDPTDGAPTDGVPAGGEPVFGGAARGEVPRQLTDGSARRPARSGGGPVGPARLDRPARTTGAARPAGLARPAVTELRLSAFAGHRAAVHPLGPVTLFTGASGSGKSTALRAYEALARLGAGEDLAAAFPDAAACVPERARPDAQGRRGFRIGCTVDGPAGPVRLDLAVQVEPSLRIVGERLTCRGRTLLTTALRDPGRSTVQAEWHTAGTTPVTRAPFPDDLLGTALLPLRVAGKTKGQLEVLAAAEQMVVALRSVFPCDPQPRRMRAPVPMGEGRLRRGCDNLAEVLHRTATECARRHARLAAVADAGCAGVVTGLRVEVLPDATVRAFLDRDPRGSARSAGAGAAGIPFGRSGGVSGATNGVASTGTSGVASGVAGAGTSGVASRVAIPAPRSAPVVTPLGRLGDGELRYLALALVLLTGPGVLAMDQLAEVPAAMRTLTVLADGLDGCLDGPQLRALLGLAAGICADGHIRLVGAVGEAAAGYARETPGVSVVDLGRE
ncbi:ATP-binding protein [Streptomyces sp. NPDC046237]|uniref:ATP-binding protein n=1 Tax=Streptomyces sp. NPDC046237 TaxID=3154914 RepID=UPI0033E3DC03